MYDGPAWKPGLYILASLDGRPLSMCDRAVLDLQSGSSDAATFETPDFIVRIVETTAHRGAVRLRAEPGQVAAMLGDLDEADAVAESLGFARRADPLDLVLEALQRFGDDAPHRLLGEWSIAVWHTARRELTLASSEPGRDRLYVADGGHRVAVSPELRRLARLDWVEDRFNRHNLLLSLGRARLRRDLGAATILRGVDRLPTGARSVMASGVRRLGRVTAPLASTTWRGSDEDAIAEIGSVLRRITRQRVARFGTVAVSLSGGLDSSLVTMLVCQERRHGQDMLCLTSASPLGSGIPDETAFASRVAEHLGLSMVAVAPGAVPSAYRPSDRYLRWVDSPLCGPRHYLDESLCAEASARGVDALFDGTAGEFTVTCPDPLAGSVGLFRRAVRQLRRWRTAPERDAWPANGFHVKLAPGVMADLPGEFGDRWRAPFLTPPRRWGSDPFGVSPGVLKNVGLTSDGMDPSVRSQKIFLDPRLVRLMAGMPSSIVTFSGLDRAPARAIMRGGLPDRVRLRTDKMAYSPDYVHRLREHAPAASERLGAYRAAGVGDWLDLPWLASGLSRMAAQGPRDTTDAFSIQLTALAAEFLLWWPGRG